MSINYFYDSELRIFKPTFVSVSSYNVTKEMIFKTISLSQFKL